MRMSTKARYGLRLMFELSLAYEDHLVQVKDIAKKQGLPEKYLEQIIILLKNSKLIQSVRGAKGGYFLSRAPEEIYLKDVVESLEGSLYPVECSINPSICPNNPTCPTTDVWLILGKKIEDYLSGITLSDLIEKHEIKKENLKKK